VPRCRKDASPEGAMCGGSGDTPVETQDSCIRSGWNPQGGRSGNLARESPKVPRCRKGAIPEGTMCGRSVKNSGRIKRLQHHERSRTARGNGPATWRGSRRRCQAAGGCEPARRDARKEREKLRPNKKTPTSREVENRKGKRPGNLARSRRRCQDAGGRKPARHDAREERNKFLPNPKAPHQERSEPARGKTRQPGEGVAEGAKMPEKRKPEGTMSGRGVQALAEPKTPHQERSEPARGKTRQPGEGVAKVPRCRKSESQKAR
jgi:hypothetical protein